MRGQRGTDPHGPRQPQGIGGDTGDQRPFSKCPPCAASQRWAHDSGFILIWMDDGALVIFYHVSFCLADWGLLMKNLKPGRVFLLAVLGASLGPAPLAQELTELLPDWDAAAAQYQVDQSNADFPVMKGAAVDADQVDLPVLVIGEGPMRGSTQFFQQRTSYAAFYVLPKGVTISITGTKYALDLGDKTDIEGDDEGTFELIEAGAIFAFSRYNVAYDISITCEDAEDVKCKAPDFLEDVKSKLVLVGGREIQ
jgi:hypothetical protein